MERMIHRQVHPSGIYAFVRTYFSAIKLPFLTICCRYHFILTIAKTKSQRNEEAAQFKKRLESADWRGQRFDETYNGDRLIELSGITSFFYCCTRAKKGEGKCCYAVCLTCYDKATGGLTNKRASRIRGSAISPQSKKREECCHKLEDLDNEMEPWWCNPTDKKNGLFSEAWLRHAKGCVGCDKMFVQSKRDCNLGVLPEAMRTLYEKLDDGSYGNDDNKTGSNSNNNNNTLHAMQLFKWWTAFFIACNNRVFLGVSSFKIKYNFCCNKVIRGIFKVSFESRLLALLKKYFLSTEEVLVSFAYPLLLLIMTMTAIYIFSCGQLAQWPQGWPQVSLIVKIWGKKKRLCDRKLDFSPSFYLDGGQLPQRVRWRHNKFRDVTWYNSTYAISSGRPPLAVILAVTPFAVYWKAASTRKNP